MDATEGAKESALRIKRQTTRQKAESFNYRPRLAAERARCQHGLCIAQAQEAAL